MIISEKEMIGHLKQAKKVLLIEPKYDRKYIPLGLAKISSFVKGNGAEVTYKRVYGSVGKEEDLICITSLFTYDSQKVTDVFRDIYHTLFKTNATVIVGGIYASLMPDTIAKNYPKVKVFKGYSKVLDRTPPDYSIDWGIEEPWDTFSYVFTTRGCPNKCAYCAVWRIEPNIWINPKWKDHITDKPNVMISDNNLSSQPIKHIRSVCDYMVQTDKHVVFDNGFDCKHITDELADILSGVKYTRSGMRLAFDRIEEDGIFQQAIMKLINAGVPKNALMAYVLFNFHDRPKDADYRMRECIKLDVRPYPQQYTPLNKTDRKTRYIGKYWTKNLAKSFRFFWLMAGYYVKMSFEEFVNSDEGKEYQLTKEDWECWNA